MKKVRFILIVLLIGSSIWLVNNKLVVRLNAPVLAQDDWWRNNWAMAGANPQRTGWNTAEVKGKLYPQWYKVIEPYVPVQVQIVAANNTLFLSTSRGLYAFNLDGSQKWVFPTEMPLGHSPTYFVSSFGNRLYVGGMDHRIYCINADTGAGIWSFEATPINESNGDITLGGGFETNPLVVSISNHVYIYAGNRNGYEYALIDQGSSAIETWKYRASGPILHSTAISKDYQTNPNPTIYFASFDSYSYALNAVTGTLVWKSSQLPGFGFSTFWPVVYNNVQNGQEYVVLSGSHSYRMNVAPGILNANGNEISRGLQHLDREIFFGTGNYPDTGKCGPIIGSRQADGTIKTDVTDDGATSNVFSYFQAKPYRRTVYILKSTNGTETDIDGDGMIDYAPILWQGTQSGPRFPALINGNDGKIYQTGGFQVRNWIDGASIFGWKPGSKYMTTEGVVYPVVDEPIQISSGGNMVYWMWGDWGGIGGFDLSIPNTRFHDNGLMIDPVNPEGPCANTPQSPSEDNNREWTYWGYGANWDDPNFLPGYNAMAPNGMYGGDNGVYGNGEIGSPPIPYQGKLYVLLDNALIAMGTQQVTPQQKPNATVVSAPNVSITVTTGQLKQRLEKEILKFDVNNDGNLDHLRTAMFNNGQITLQANKECGDSFGDYFANTSDTLIALSRAVPYLSPELVSKLKTYLHSEIDNFSPFSVTFNGWNSGAKRESHVMASDIILPGCEQCGPTQWRGSYEFEGWGQPHGGTNIPPHTFYALYTYAKAFNLTPVEVQHFFTNSVKSTLDRTPQTDLIYTKFPFVLNSFIDGYWAYLELQKLVVPSPSPTPTPDPEILSNLNMLKNKRTTTFTKDTYWIPGAPDYNSYCRAFNVSQNFIYLTPELGQYLHDNALNKITEAMTEYHRIAPYWFTAAYEPAYNEAIHQPFFDTVLMQTKVYGLKQNRSEVLKYLDVPFFERGDLFYIQNLVAVLDAPAGDEPTATPTPACTANVDGQNGVGIGDFRLILSNWAKTSGFGNSDINADGKVNGLDLVKVIKEWGRSCL